MRSGTLTIALFVVAPIFGCAALPGISDDPDHAVCEQARAKARAGDPVAAEALLERIRDLRNHHRCKYDLMLRDRGIEPNST